MVSNKAMGIHDWISEEIATLAGMHWPLEYSAILFKGKRYGQVYIGEIINDANLHQSLNLIIIDSANQNGLRREYFLGKIVGKPRGERSIEESIRFDVDLDKIWRGRNKVQAPYLESKILDELDKEVKT